MSIYVAAVLVLFGFDHLLLAVLGKYKKMFRIGITSKAILLADRETKLIYFSGLKEVSKQQQSLFFDYSNDLQLSLPSDSIPDSKIDIFKTTFENNLNRDKVYFKESFKSFTSAQKI